MIAYFNGQYIDKEDIRISPDDRGFLFADGLYEVIRSYNGKLFEARRHLERMAYGAKHLRLGLTDVQSLVKVAETLIEKNGLTSGDATVYIQVTRGAAPRKHCFPGDGTPLTVVAWAGPFIPHSNDLKSGISVITVPDQRWGRCDLKTIGLTANVQANQSACDAGAGEALFTRDGIILEGSHSNFMAVYDGEVFTHPASNQILGGITREVIISLCKNNGIRLTESPLCSTDIHMADELFICGTTVEITPVIKIDDHIPGNGTPGPVTRMIQDLFTDHVKRSC